MKCVTHIHRYHENFDTALLHLSIHNNNNNFILQLNGTLNIHFQLLPLCCVTRSRDCHVTEPQIIQQFSP